MLPAVWLCKKLHRLPVFCWTVTDPEEMSRLEREGFLVIFEGFQPEARPSEVEEDDKRTAASHLWMRPPGFKACPW